MQIRMYMFSLVGLLVCQLRTATSKFPLIVATPGTGSVQFDQFRVQMSIAVHTTLHSDVCGKCFDDLSHTSAL